MNGQEKAEIQKQVTREGVSLKEYFEALLEMREKALDERADLQQKAVDAALIAAEKAVTAALAAAEKAVITAYDAQAKVNEKQNEFRQALIDQQNTFLPRETFDTQGKEVARRLEQLEATARRGLGMAEGVEQARVRLLGYVGASAAAAGIIGFLLSRV